MHASLFDAAEGSFPVRDEIRLGESGQGYALRMAECNGLPGLLYVKRLLQKTHSASLDAKDGPQLSQWFGAGILPLQAALEQLPQGRREQGLLYAGHALGRSYFLNRTYPRVCPDCLKEDAICRTAWDISLTVACSRHSRLLIDQCPTCRRSLSWNRPGLGFCFCGFGWEFDDVAERASPCEMVVAHAVDLRMDDQPHTVNAACFPDAAHDLVGGGLSSLLRGLSLDGVLRILFSLATMSRQSPDVQAGPRRRSSLEKSRQTIAQAASMMESMVNREPPDTTALPRQSVVIDLLCEAQESVAGSAEDGSMAWSLLQNILVRQLRSTLGSKHAALAQRVLF